MADNLPPTRRVIRALAFLTILLPGFAHAHGNVAIEEDPCVRRVGGSLVHFNAYQPQHERPHSTARRFLVKGTHSSSLTS